MTLPDIHRRRWLCSAAGLLTSALYGCNVFYKAPHIVIIGGGYGGAAAARYLSLWAKKTVNITLITDKTHYFSCPGVNRFIAGLGSRPVNTYDALKKRGIQIIPNKAQAIDREKKCVILSDNTRIPYDRLIASPGITYDNPPFPVSNTLSAWTGDREAEILAQRIQTIEAHSTIIITVPLAPFKCPAAPYERACLMAWRLKQDKKQARIIILDENSDIVSKSALFHHVFDTYYPDIIDYYPETPVLDITPSGMVSTPFDTFSATLINRIPPQRASFLLETAGLMVHEDVWCPIDWQTMRSIADPNIYVIGDAVQNAPELPKSAHVTNNQAKVCAAAVLRDLSELPAYQEPVIMNCCFSYVSGNEAIHIASVSRYNRDTHAMTPLPAAFSLSEKPSQTEAQLTESWLTNIRQDTFG